MDLINSLSSILKQSSENDSSQPMPDLDRHFDTVAQSVHPDTLAEGISAAFRSDQTPDFGQMLGSLFNHADPELKAGMLSQLLGAAGPELISRVLGGDFGVTLNNGSITPEAASSLSPEAVSAIATEAHKE